MTFIVNTPVIRTETRQWTVPAEAVVKGDGKVACIAAASILAKTARDADLLRLHSLYPQYAFDQHKGYGTALHLQMLREHGPCAEHRRSFAPIKAFGLTP